MNFDKLLPVHVDLSEIVKKWCCWKDVYNTTKIIEEKLPDITNLDTNTTLNAKINDVKEHLTLVTKSQLLLSLLLRIKYLMLLVYLEKLNITQKIIENEKTKNLSWSWYICYYSKNELSENVKTISKKLLTKNLINRFSNLNGAKYFSLCLFKII